MEAFKDFEMLFSPFLEISVIQGWFSAGVS